MAPFGIHLLFWEPPRNWPAEDLDCTLESVGQASLLCRRWYCQVCSSLPCPPISVIGSGTRLCVRAEAPLHSHIMTWDNTGLVKSFLQSRHSYSILHSRSGKHRHSFRVSNFKKSYLHRRRRRRRLPPHHHHHYHRHHPHPHSRILHPHHSSSP